MSVPLARMLTVYGCRRHTQTEGIDLDFDVSWGLLCKGVLLILLSVSI